jgi:hypothetical protein
MVTHPWLSSVVLDVRPSAYAQLQHVPDPKAVSDDGLRAFDAGRRQRPHQVLPHCKNPLKQRAAEQTPLVSAINSIAVHDHVVEEHIVKPACG